MATIFTIQQLLSPPAYADVKTDVLTRLEKAGFTSIRSLSPEAGPIAFVETEAQTLDRVNQSAAFLTASCYNDTAEGDALAELAREVYQNDKRTGTKARGYVTLTDTGQGPFTFDVTTVSFSTGIGGKTFTGVAAEVDGFGNPIITKTLPKNGTVKVYVEAEALGSAYNIAATTLTTFSRGVLAGVAVVNPVGWQSDSLGVTGTDAETDPNLRQRNRKQWETLSAGATQGMYEKRVRDADPQITRVSVKTNLDLTDPGLVTVLLAGDAGAVGGSVVANAQLAIAPLFVGGDKIPETARAVAVSATNLAVNVAGTVVVDSTYNTQTFLDQINTDLTTYFKSFLIGGGKLGKISYDRVVGVIVNRAGLTNAIIFDGTGITVNGLSADLPIAYNQVPVLSSTLALQPL